MSHVSARRPRTLLLALVALACGGSPEGARPPAPLSVRAYEASLFARALDVSCAPPDAQVGVEGCLALVRFNGQLQGHPEVPPSDSHGYGDVWFERTDAQGRVAWAKTLVQGYAPDSRQWGRLLDEDVRVRLRADGSFLLWGSYSERVFFGNGANNQELGPVSQPSPFIFFFRPDGTFDDWADTNNGKELHGRAAACLPDGTAVLGGTCQGDVPLDEGHVFPCGDGPHGFLLSLTGAGGTLGGALLESNRISEVADLAADTLGNVYVSGSFVEKMRYRDELEDLATGGRDAFLMKLGPDGKRAWILMGSGLGEDRGGRLARVPGGVLWTLTASRGARVGAALLHESGHAVALVSDAGAVAWTARLAAGGPEQPLGVAAAEDGSFALYGDGYLGRFTAGGTESWTRGGAEVRGASFTKGALWVAATVLGTEAFGAAVGSGSGETLRGLVASFPR